MQPTFRLENTTELSRTAMKLQALTADLRWHVQLLDSDIRDEEKRTGSSNVPTRTCHSRGQSVVIARMRQPEPPGDWSRDDDGVQLFVFGRSAAPTQPIVN